MTSSVSVAIAAGVHKFILRPIATDTEDVLTQTKLLIDEVIPQVEAMNHTSDAA